MKTKTFSFTVRQLMFMWAAVFFTGICTTVLVGGLVFFAVSFFNRLVQILAINPPSFPVESYETSSAVVQQMGENTGMEMLMIDFQSNQPVSKLPSETVLGTLFGKVDYILITQNISDGGQVCKLTGIEIEPRSIRLSFTASTTNAEFIKFCQNHRKTITAYVVVLQKNYLGENSVVVKQEEWLITKIISLPPQ